MTTTDTDTDTDTAIAVELIDPDPENRQAQPDKAMIRSVADIGIVEPLVLRPHPDDQGRYMIVAGERRWRSAIAAEMPTVPAVVRDYDADDLAVIRLVENLQREDLTPSEEAEQLRQAVDCGLTRKDLARKIGKSATWVKQRFDLLTVPAKTRKLVDSGKLTIADACCLTRLAEHPDLADDVAERLTTSQYGDVDQMVTRALEDHERREAVAAIREKAEVDGVTIIEPDPTRSAALPRGAITLSDLGVTGKTLTAHRGEPCHAIVLEGSRWGTPKAVPICTKPKRHRTDGASGIAAGKADEDLEATRARREEKAKRVAQEAWHRDQVRQIVEGNISRAEAADLIQEAFVDRCHPDTVKEACAIVGLEADVNEATRQRDWRAALDAYMDTSKRAHQAGCLALAGAASPRWWGSWADTWEAFLHDKGYEPYQDDE